MLGFTQLNLHKASLASTLAGREMEGQTQRILMLTEPYTVASKIVGFPNNVKIIYDRSLPVTTPPRAAVLTSPDIRAQSLDAWCSRDCAVALARVQGKQTALVSIYRDITAPVIDEKLEKLLDMLNHRNLPTIICMDSNAHSALYGPTNNSRGDLLEDFIIAQGLTVENMGDTPTFEVKRGEKLIQTHVDVTLSRNIHFELSHWRVDRAYNASDHNTIRFEVESSVGAPRKVRPWGTADWKLFNETLRRSSFSVPEQMSMKKLDKLVERFYAEIMAALDQACPVITVTESVRQSTWSTDKHTREKERISKLYARAKTSNDQALWQEYKTADKNFKRMCHRDKNRAWKLFKESIQTEPQTMKLVRLAQRREQRDINTLTRADGTTTDPGSETISLLTSTHFPAATDVRHVTYNNRRNAPTADILKKYDGWINPQLIRQALAGFEKKKSPGPDGLKPLIFEHLPPECIDILDIIYRSSIHLGYTPKAWKKTKVIYISKPGKDSYDTPKSFRPISLSNYFLKGLERLVGWNMDKALLQYPIHHKQHGFTTGKSTESAVSSTVNYIESFIMKKQHCVGVFLDISAAFDSIRPGHVRHSLLKHGGHPEMVQWYFNYITHRDIIVDMYGDIALFSTGIGFPQGGVCSAKFWLIAFDTAIQIINTMGVMGNGYADDCSALYGGRRLDHAIKRLQKVLNELTRWGRTCGLHFNPAKSVAVVFTRRRKTPPCSLVIDGKPIPYESSVKYLGITLDSKLHWQPHIDHKVSAAKRFISNVASITRNNWGPKPKLMRWAYLSVVRPMLCYGSMIWGHRAPANEAKLRRVNRMALDTFASFPRSTPTTALEVALDVPPLHLHCLREGLASRVRLQGVVGLDWDGTSHTTNHATSHLLHWAQHLERAAVRPENTDRCSLAKWNKSFTVNRDSFDGSSKHRSLTQINIFTDGSKQNEQVGAGCVIYQNRVELYRHSVRLPDSATVFQAEIAAVTTAARAIELLGSVTPRYVKIFIDSQAAIRALGNPMVTSRAVEQAIDALNRAAANAVKLTLVWIPAHRGYFGNTLADDMAKAGTTLPKVDFQIGHPPSFFKSKLEQYMYDIWTREWQQSTAAKHSKLFYLSPSKLKARYVYKLARIELGRFVRLISGHNNLNYFQSRIGLFHDPSCRFCDHPTETFTHLLYDCPPFRQVRNDIFTDKLPCNDMRWSVRDLLCFSFTPPIDAALHGTWAHSDPAGTNLLDASLCETPPFSSNTGRDSDGSSCPEPSPLQISTYD